MVGGDFGGNDQSYGYFNAVGTSFPFEEGLVLSTGRLQNTKGPNTTLSDDDAPGWIGDSDLELILDEPNTINATLIEFEFSSISSEISFRYIFASEEYQEGDPNTCQFSDLFGFLIRPQGTQQFENIALVPDTQTPVKVTTVHPEIPGGCSAENEFFFESFNGPDVPINFNGQTTVIEASTTIIPNTIYEVKLVIADEQNFRFDSAVFIEAGSFQLATDLGPNRLLSTGNALCENEVLELEATMPNASSYTWFRNDVLLPTETNETLLVDSPGTYNVVVTLDIGCESFGEIVIEFSDNPQVSNIELLACDFNNNGFAIFDLFDSTDAVTNNDGSSIITDFFIDEMSAIQNQNPIPNPTTFENTSISQNVYARVVNQAGCFSIATITLLTAGSVPLVIPVIEVCDDVPVDGFTDFDLNEITTNISTQLPASAVVQYYKTLTDALTDENNINSPYRNTTPGSGTLFSRVFSTNDCFEIGIVPLEVLETPILAPDATLNYCITDFPEIIRINSGVQGDASEVAYVWQRDGMLLENTLAFLDVNETGTYVVQVTANNGCSSSRTITVNPSEPAIVTAVNISNGTNPTVTVEVTGTGDYEYALDNESGPYQSFPFFINVSPGFHTIFIRDRNGCGIIMEQIGILGIPNFFTPNEDGINDVWQITGTNELINTVTECSVFDRFGKTVFSSLSMNTGWDGTYLGRELPSNDYWYRIRLQKGTIFTGHFSLKR